MKNDLLDGALTPGAPIPANLPRLSVTDVRWRWITDYYDGPMSGIVAIGEVLYWAEVPSDLEVQSDLDEKPSRRGREYLTIELTAAQLAEEEHQHDLFRRYVGTHWDSDEDDISWTQRIGTDIEIVLKPAATTLGETHVRELSS